MPGPLIPGQSIEIRVTDLAFGGAGVGRHEGFVVLVPCAAPGDRLRARVVTARPGYAVGRLVDLIEPAPDRVPPRCRHFDECGGCAYQHLPGPRQARIKASQVREALRRIGGLGDPPVLDPIPAPSGYAYRTRVDLTAFLDARGRARLGYHRREAPGQAFPVEECAIAAPGLEALRARVAEALLRARVPPFDTRTRRGLLRRVVLRASARGDTLIELRTARAAAQPLRGLLAALAGAPGLRGIVRVLDRGGRRSLCGPARVLWGRATLEDEVLGLRLEFPAGAFAQTHAAMVETLYREALRAAGGVSGRACLDLFCGVGALSLLLARAGAREVVGVEADLAAVQAASRNARRAGLGACRFVHAQVERALRSLSVPASGGRFETAVVNPPRSGLSVEALRRLLRLGPARVAYVSCDPSTLARDLKRLAAGGYRLEWTRPLDLFPQTAHVETVSALARG